MNQKDPKKDLHAQVQALEHKVGSIMTKEAFERYGRVKLAHPHVAMECLAILAQMVQKHHTQIITEETLKKVLQKIRV